MYLFHNSANSKSLLSVECLSTLVAELSLSSTKGGIYSSIGSTAGIGYYGYSLGLLTL